MATSIAESALGLSKDDIADIAKSLGVDDAYLDVISMEFTTVEWENNKKIRDAVAYKGFDAKTIAEQFFKKAEENPISSTDKPITVGSFQIYEKNDAKTDLLFFLKVFLERGNNLQKALLRCDGKVANILKRKASAYGIVFAKSGGKTVLGNKHLTLSRIAQAFARCTAILILNDKIPSKLRSRFFSDLPLLITHTIFPALIPSNISATKDLKDLATIINVEMSYMLADPKRKRMLAVKSLKELMEHSRTFVEAAANGSLVDEKSRCTTMIKAGIIKVNSTTGGFVLTDEMLIVMERMRSVLSKRSGTLVSIATQLEPMPSTSKAEDGSRENK